MNPTRLRALLQKFPNQTILVVGDVMLDRFLWGRVSRISPEAPVPVVEVQRESSFPGGAANVARNLRALGGAVKAIGITGSDHAGAELRDLLDDQGVDTNGIFITPDRPTTLKTRIVAHHQQVVRFDHETTTPIDAALEKRIRDYFNSQISRAAAVIFEDYGKGVLSQSLLSDLHRIARRHGVITTADPTARHLLHYQRLTAITPNRAEAFAATGTPHAPPLDDVLADKSLLAVGAALLRKWRPDNLLVTLGEQGMCLFRAGKKPHHIPTVAQEVFDVSGAGDTVIAALTLALAAGADPVDAATISNHAGGIVVGKVGTATCTPAELRESLARHR